MTRGRLAPLLAAAALGGCAAPHFTFTAPPAPAAAFDIRRETTAAAQTVEHFFGTPFSGATAVTLVPSRAAFDAALPASWGMTPTQCWMVAAGVADRLVMLSPGAWKTDACDHRAGDLAEARQILTHELVHVFHGQHNPTRDFTGMDDAGWFVEGLAVLVSGQLDAKRLSSARAAVAAGHGPAKLADAWSGKDKYGISGSMVAYIDRRYGRAALRDLLAATTNAGILRRLGTDEAGFLAAWKSWLEAGAAPA